MSAIGESGRWASALRFRDLRSFLMLAFKAELGFGTHSLMGGANEAPRFLLLQTGCNIIGDCNIGRLRGTCIRFGPVSCTASTLRHP